MYSLNLFVRAPGAITNQADDGAAGREGGSTSDYKPLAQRAGRALQLWRRLHAAAKERHVDPEAPVGVRRLARRPTDKEFARSCGGRISGFLRSVILAGLTCPLLLGTAAANEAVIT